MCSLDYVRGSVVDSLLREGVLAPRPSPPAIHLRDPRLSSPLEKTIRTQTGPT